VIRVVLDTNVLVSGLLSPKGPPGRIVEFLAHDLIHLVYCDEILLEYADVLHRRELHIPPDLTEALLRDIQERGTIVVTIPWPTPTPDDSDAVFLAAAEAGEATLVTGNLKHYPPNIRCDVAVLSPRDFVDRHSADIAARLQERARDPG
jgi:putative PIN family toxin of toxin-antitoxin system